MSEDATLDDFVSETESEGQTNEDEVSVGELQQLEQSPIDSWELVSLGDILSLEYGDNLPSGSREQGTVPVYGSNGQVDTHTEAAVESPGIVLGRKGSIGEIRFSDEPFWPIDTTYYITKNETSQNLRFLYYLLQNIQLERLNAASAIPGLNRNDTYGLNAIVPPLSEQRKIASVLYNFDQAIQKTEEIIDQYERVKTGLSQDLLQMGTRNHEFVETDSRYGQLPENWSLERLVDVTEIVGRTEPPTDVDKYWGGDIPWATPDDIRTLDGPTIFKTEQTVTQAALEEVSSNVVPPGSVLLTTRATVGLCAVNEVEMTTSRAFKDLIPGDRLDTWYLYYRMSMMEDYLNRLGWGSTFTEVIKPVLENVTIPVPELEEQKEIGEKIRSIDRVITENIRVKNQYQRLKQGLMQDLLSGTVHTTDTNIEVPEEVAQHG